MAKLTKLTQDEQDNVIYDARFGDLESLKDIFTNEVEPSVLKTIKDEYSLATPLHMASANGHFEVVEYLLSLLDDKEEIKALVNSQNESGNTALHWASLNGHLEIVKILCEFGADPFIKNCFDHDSIFEAENNSKEEVENYFLQKFDDEESNKKEEFDEMNVEYNEGTEIEKTSKDDSEAMTELKEKAEELKV